MFARLSKVQATLEVSMGWGRMRQLIAPKVSSLLFLPIRPNLSLFLGVSLFGVAVGSGLAADFPSVHQRHTKMSARTRTHGKGSIW